MNRPTHNMSRPRHHEVSPVYYIPNNSPTRRSANSGNVEAGHPVAISCCNNGKTLAFWLNIITLVMGGINVAIIGYNFSYYKGSYRTSLFHSELTYLVLYAIAFSFTAMSIIVFILQKADTYQDNLHALLSQLAACIASALGGMILLIQLGQYGRYFVEQYEIKVFAGVFGLVQSALHLLAAFLQHKDMAIAYEN